VARQEGLSEDLVAMIDEGFEASTLSARHKALIRYADAFLVDPSSRREDVRSDMLRYFTPPEIVEVTACLALCMGFSKIAIVLGQAPEAMPTLVVPTPKRPAQAGGSSPA
jgi:alkylhydroperoxidase family enzyme